MNKPVRFTASIKADAKGNLPTKIELARTGKWSTPWHGDFELTTADFHEAVANFNAGVYRVQGTEPLTGTLDHNGGAAAFRITNIYVEGDSLMADVTWTDMGKEKLQRDEYRYISFEYNPRSMPLEDPEEAGKFIPNVLTGATLTNDPLFKKLKPVMASARSGSDKSKGVSMNLEELRAKDPATLKEDEKQYLVEHKAELTDEERTKFGLADGDGSNDSDQNDADDNNDDSADNDADDQDANGDKQNVNASAKTGVVSISAAKLKQLEAAAKAGLEAKAQLDRERTERQVRAHVKTGRIKSEQAKEVADVLLASSPAMRKRLEGIFASLPENRVITNNQQGNGDDAADGKTSMAAQLNASVEKMALEKKITYGEALRLVTAEQPELANYSEEDDE